MPPDLQVQHQYSHGASLPDLPTEIVQMIAEHLSPADTASLSLCSHGLLRLLGRGRWAFPSDEDRSLFLVRLDRQSPTFFYCESCASLHPCGSVGPPGPAFQPDKLHRHVLERNEPPIASLWRSVDVHPVHSLYDFNYTHLQLAMKRHYHGPDYGMSTEALGYTEVRCFEERSITTLLSVEARTCSSTDDDAMPILCLRIQNWALVNNPASMDDFVRKIGFVWICTHLSVREANISQFIRRQLDACYNGRGGADPSTHDNNSDNNFFKCRMCGIDYQPQIRRCGDDGLALVITKWLDLGTGKIPMGFEWKRHLGISLIPEVGLCIESAGEVSRLFDQNGPAGPSLDSLTLRNQSYLAGRHFTTELDWWDQKTWILQGEGRLPSDYLRPLAPVPDRASKLKESTDAIKDLTGQIALLCRTVEEKARAIQYLI